MLNESKLLSFINKDKTFTLHFFEGQKIIHDLAMINELTGQSLKFLRDSTLTAAHLITLLKPSENLGFYIDNLDPYFIYKIEMNDSGQMRTLIMPENFGSFPKKLTGKSRLSKIFPNQKEPYTSIIELSDHHFHEVVDDILKKSYQINSTIIISDTADQSILLTKLPKEKIEQVEAPTNDISLENYHSLITTQIEQIFNMGINDEKSIIKSFENMNFNYMSGKEIKFSCSCSRERMIEGLSSLTQSVSIEELFESKNEIETKCDYCKTFYLITRGEIEAKSNLQ